MKLLTKALEAQIPALYSNEEKSSEEIMVITKFFTPDSSWTWYVTEGSYVDEDGYYDTDKEKVDYLFFGLVVGLETELGYFSLSELESVRGPLGLPIERDLYWQPHDLRTVRHNLEKY